MGAVVWLAARGLQLARDADAGRSLARDADAFRRQRFLSPVRPISALRFWSSEGLTQS